METTATISISTQRRLTILLDVMTLLSLGLLAILLTGNAAAAVSVIACFNMLLIIVLRLWLMKMLGIHANVSLLNLFLKRIAGLVVGLVVALTILPFACLLALPLIKSKSSGPVLHRIFLSRKDKIVGKGFTFRRCGSLMDDPLLQKIPVLLNLITGGISLWNLSRTEIIYPEDQPSELSESSEPLEPLKPFEPQKHEYIQQTLFAQEG